MTLRSFNICMLSMSGMTIIAICRIPLVAVFRPNRAISSHVSGVSLAAIVILY